MCGPDRCPTDLSSTDPAPPSLQAGLTQQLGELQSQRAVLMEPDAVRARLEELERQVMGTMSAAVARNLALEGAVAELQRAQLQQQQLHRQQRAQQQGGDAVDRGSAGRRASGYV